MTIPAASAPVSDEDKQRQILSYINDTLGQYNELNPNAILSVDQLPNGRADQLKAISGMGKYASAGGLDAIGEDQLQGQLGGLNQQFTGQKQAAQRGLIGRGVSPYAGAGLGAGLDASAAFGAPTAAAASSAAAGANQRAMQALQQYAAMGGQVRGQDLGINQLAFQNQLQQLQGKAAARNQLGNYYTNLTNAERAGSNAATQTGMGAAGLGLALLALL